MMRCLGVMVLAMTISVAGCGSQGGGAPSGQLDQLDRLPDSDGDGLVEIDPPAGIEFDPAAALGIRITNTITRGQAESASGVNLPSAVSGSVTVDAATSVTLTYAGGVEQVLRGTYPLAPQEIAFEVACPQSIAILVTALADTPVTTPQAVQTFGPFLAVQGPGDDAYECGVTLSMQTSADPETGELVASVVVE